MSYWHIKFILEENQYFSAKMEKTSPNQQVTDVIQHICHVPYPVFTESENKHTVINTKKIIGMEIEEVDE